MNVGARISYFRKAKGYSVNKLANAAGISQSYLRDIELGHKDNPTVLCLSSLCEALGISLKEFFDEETTGCLTDSELQKNIYKLTLEQRNALNNFLQLLISCPETKDSNMFVPVIRKNK